MPLGQSEVKRQGKDLTIVSAFEAVGECCTRITTFVEIPGMDASADRGFLTSRLERSQSNIKRLIESET